MSPRRHKALCCDCRVDTLAMPGSSRPFYLTEWYMVRPEVWAAAGMTSNGGYLCLGCLAKRLGRHLDGRDLADVLCNHPDYGNDTPRLHALKLAADIAWFIAGRPPRGVER
jgi:hypothetical protein